MGPMEFEPDDRNSIAVALSELDAASKAAMDALASRHP
jgi:hypothetical protein